LPTFTTAMPAPRSIKHVTRGSRRIGSLKQDAPSLVFDE
jgi:hypothetical protein